MRIKHMPTKADLDPLAAQILDAIRRHLRILQRRPVPFARADLSLHRAVKAAREDVIEIDLHSWAHPASEAERKAAQRALLRLETAGRLERQYRGLDGRRATHVRLLRGVRK